MSLLVSDIHLSSKPPVARSAEPDWFTAQARQLKELQRLQWQYACPVLCSGDVLHQWASSSELVNFAITHLPKMYSICGQHDLSHHRLKDICKTSYWTLVEAGRLINLEHGHPLNVSVPTELNLHGFPWGCPPRPLERPCDLVLEIALVHRFVWLPGKGYPGAPEESRLHNCGKQFRGYDVVVIGDNHKPWLAKMGKTTIINVGGFYRRHADEIGHRPSVGLLHADGSVTRHYLDVSQDQFLPPDELKKKSTVAGVDVTPFVDAVGNLRQSIVDFETEVRRHVEVADILPLAKEIILEALEKCK